MRLIENEYTELKERYAKSIIKTIIAFANSYGGTLYIGVTDDGTVVGLEDADETALQNYLSAEGMTPKGVFVRQGPSSAPASDTLIRKMIKDTDGDIFEEMRSLQQNLTFDVFEEKCRQQNLTIDEPQKKTLGLQNGDGSYTNLALLLSDQCPHIIKVAYFKGKDNLDFQDRQEFTGSLLKQLDDAYDYLRVRNKMSASFTGLLRIDQKDYPEAALREVLLNAIVHRDYGILAPTIININDVETEFISVGGLYSDITLEDAFMGVSICRNRKLANVFYRLNLIESYGTGLRKIKESYGKFSQAPAFLVSENVFKVVLPNVNCSTNKPEMTTADLEFEIVEYIRSFGAVTRIEIQNRFSMSQATTTRYLNRMIEDGKLTKYGNGKNTKYSIFVQL